MTLLDRLAGQLGYARKENRIVVSSVPDWYRESGIPITEDIATNVEAYNKVQLVHRCVRKIAWAVSALPLKFYKGEGAKREEVTEGAFVNLFYRPNPNQSYLEFTEEAIGYLLLSGNCYIALEGLQFSRVPREMYIIRPDKMTIVPGADSFVGEYRYKPSSGAKPVIYEPREIAHIRLFNPSSDYYGLSMVEPIKSQLTLDLNAWKFNTNFFKFGARPSGYLTTDQNLNEDAIKAITEAWNQSHGGIDRMGKTAVLQKGMKYESFTAYKDIEFGALLKMSREEILGALGNPPAVAGVFEYANYANAREQTAMFYRDTIMPLSARFCAAVNVQILEEFWPGIWCEQDFSEVTALQNTLDEKTRAASSLVASGIATPNEVRTQILGMDASDDAAANELRPPPGAGLFGLSGQPPSGTKSAKLIDDPVRTEKWKVIDEKAKSKEPRFAKMMRAYLTGQIERVVERTRDLEPITRARDHDPGNGDPLDISRQGKSDIRIKIAEPQNRIKLIETKDLLADLEDIFKGDEELAILIEIGGPEIEALMVSAAEDAYRAIGFTGAFDVTNPMVAAEINKKIFKFTEKVVATSKELVRGVLLDAQATGATIEETARMISDVVGRHVDYRARRIARTETISAHNAGSYLGYEQSGVVHKKEWLTARDGDVRDQHAGADGEVVNTKDPFVMTGEPLMYPGDGAGSAGNVINCRCTILPVIEEE